MVATTQPGQIGAVAEVNGRETDKASPSFDMLVCPTVNLWDSEKREKKVGELQDGDRVRILGAAFAGGRFYYEVEAVEVKGIQGTPAQKLVARLVGGRPLRGWVSAPFLRSPS